MKIYRSKLKHKRTHSIFLRSQFLLLIIGLLYSSVNVAQEDSTFQKNGKVYGDVFLNANYNIEEEYASFRFNRLHFGYLYQLSEKVYFNGMIESAKEDYEPSVSPFGGEYNGITNLFEFCVGYKSEKLDGKFGLIGTAFNQQQEQLWQHRHIDKVFADKYGLAPTNDFGVLAVYKPLQMLKIDVAITNGEGHKSLQRDSVFRYAIGGTFTLAEKIIARAYTDFVKLSDVSQTNLIGIIGYADEKVSVGVEWNQQMNTGGFDNFDRNGISAYASYNINSKYNAFARFDQVNSNKPAGFTQNWNAMNDGSLIIAGVQYSLMDGLLVAVDYRMWDPSDSNANSMSLIFLDVAVGF